jgi:hypothetical protein
MAGVGLLALIVEVLFVLPRYVRLTKRLNELTLLYEDNLRLTHDELQLLSRSIDEARVLLRPYQRLRKWLAHPITLALYASYRRRRALRRRAIPAR